MPEGNSKGQGVGWQAARRAAGSARPSCRTAVSRSHYAFRGLPSYGGGEVVAGLVPPDRLAGEEVRTEDPAGSTKRQVVHENSGQIAWQDEGKLSPSVERPDTEVAHQQSVKQEADVEESDVPEEIVVCQEWRRRMGRGQFGGQTLTKTVKQPDGADQIGVAAEQDLAVAQEVVAGHERSAPAELPPSLAGNADNPARLLAHGGAQAMREELAGGNDVISGGQGVSLASRQAQKDLATGCAGEAKGQFIVFGEGVGIEGALGAITCRHQKLPRIGGGDPGPRYHPGDERAHRHVLSVHLGELVHVVATDAGAPAANHGYHGQLDQVVVVEGSIEAGQGLGVSHVLRILEDKPLEFAPLNFFPCQRPAQQSVEAVGLAGRPGTRGNDRDDARILFGKPANRTLGRLIVGVNASKDAEIPVARVCQQMGQGLRQHRRLLPGRKEHREKPLLDLLLRQGWRRSSSQTQARPQQVAKAVVERRKEDEQ